MIIWSFLVWYTFPILLNTVHYIQKVNWKHYLTFAENINSPFYGRCSFRLWFNEWSFRYDYRRRCELLWYFYIGGTKIGALCGEAIVFTKQNEPKHFTTRIKHHGALLAKGRLTGIQFLELFTDDLYFKISRHAIEMANKMKEGFLKKDINSILIHLLTNNSLF